MEQPLQTSHDRANAGSRVIKRYANRKLYDTRDSRYVTLQQIAGYVRAGEEVSIIDNTTKEDLTHVTLAQIIYEEEKSSVEDGRAASVGTLRQLIQNGGERLISTLREGPVGKLISRKEERELSAAELPPQEEAPSNRDAKRSLLVSPKEAWDELQRLADDRMRGVLGHALTHVQQLQAEVRRLHARIEELEGKLVKMSRRKGEDPEQTENAPTTEESAR